MRARVLLGLLAEALELAQLVVRKGSAKVVHRLDSEFRPKALDRLGAESLNSKECNDAGWVLLPERP